MALKRIVGFEKRFALHYLDVDEAETDKGHESYTQRHTRYILDIIILKDMKATHKDTRDIHYIFAETDKAHES